MFLQINLLFFVYLSKYVHILTQINRHRKIILKTSLNVIHTAFRMSTTNVAKFTGVKSDGSLCDILSSRGDDGDDGIVESVKYEILRERAATVLLRGICFHLIKMGENVLVQYLYIVLYGRRSSAKSHFRDTPAKHHVVVVITKGKTDLLI